VPLASAGPAQQFGIAVALARLHDPAALAPLSDAVKNNDAENPAPWPGREALGECGLAEGTNALTLFIMDPEPSVREKAQAAIERIRAQNKR